MLADGTVTMMSFHSPAVDRDGALRSVLVLAADGGTLIGMSLLHGYDPFIEMRDSGIVTITSRT